MEEKRLEANGLQFAYLEAGPADGPLVVLLHGFPDNAYSWEYQLPALGAAGYRAVAPWLRGYPPTEIPPDGYYDRATLVVDVRALIDALNGGRPALLVGQDWGAAIGYGVLAAFPEWVERAVILAVPHPTQIRRTLRRSPKHAFRSFHWFLFQLPAIPEWLCRVNDYAFLETLWRLWSHDYRDQEHVAAIRRSMAQPGALEASLAYYRALLSNKRQDPALAEVRAAMEQPITVPTRALCGAQDMRRHMLAAQRDLFTGPYEWDTVEDAGHFLHREQPEAINREIRTWLAQAPS